MTFFLDSFDRADDTTLGADWVLVSPSTSARFYITGNRAITKNASVNTALLSTDKGPPVAGPQFAAVTLDTADTAVAGWACVRLTVVNTTRINGYGIVASSTAVRLHRFDDTASASTNTVLAENTSFTRAYGDRLAISVVGSLITGYVNGVQVLQATDSTFTTGRVGFRSFGAQNTYYNDFETGIYPDDAAQARGVPAPATTAPGQVTGLTAGAVTDTTAVVSYDAAATASTYLVEYRTGSGSWTALAPTSARTVTITGLTPNTTYEVRASASNSAGTGPVSSTITTTTAAAVSNPPGQVTGLTFGAATTTTLTPSWATTTGSTSYVVEHRIAGSTGAWTAITGVTGTSTTITGLAAGQSYEVRVSAVNSAGTGTASQTSTSSTAASATVVTTTNAIRPSGKPAWRGLVRNLNGKWIRSGDLLHRMHADFWGPTGPYVPPSWLTVSGATVELTSAGGGALRLGTGPGVDAVASIKLSTQIDTSLVRGILIEVNGHGFTVANPSVDWRMFAAAGTAGASALNPTGSLAVLCSQGENNRTTTYQSQAGQDAVFRRHVGLYVAPATKEAWLMERDSVIGYRDANSTWTNGLVDVGLSLTSKGAAGAELRLASLTVSIFA